MDCPECGGHLNSSLSAQDTIGFRLAGQDDFSDGLRSAGAIAMDAPDPPETAL